MLAPGLSGPKHVKTADADNTSISTREGGSTVLHGTSKPYTLTRLERDHPELFDRVVASGLVPRTLAPMRTSETTVLPRATLAQTRDRIRWDRPRDNKALTTYCRRRTANPSPASIDQISTVVGSGTVNSVTSLPSPPA